MERFTIRRGFEFRVADFDNCSSKFKRHAKYNIGLGTNALHFQPLPEGTPRIKPACAAVACGNNRA
jgi:hypothetical protein